MRIVNVVVPGTTTGCLDQETTEPLGAPETLIVTEPVKPPVPVTLTVYVVDVPWVTVRVAGVAVTPKSARDTTNVTWTEWVSVPDVPVTVSG